MEVTKSQYEYFIKKPPIAGTLTTQQFTHKKFGCRVRRHIQFGTNGIVAANIDGKRFYVMADRTSGAMTEGVKRTLDYIGRFEKRTKRTPTVKEVARALKTTVDTIRMNVKVLCNGGYITKKNRVVGSIKLIPVECPVCHKKTEWPYDHKCGN